MAGAGARKRPTTPSGSGPDADFRPAVADLPARLPAHLRPRCRPAGRADGQFRGRAPEHRRRPRGDAGAAADRRRRSRTAASRRQPALIGADRGAEAVGRDLPPDGPRLARRRALATRTMRPRWHASLADAGVPRRACTPSPTAATRRRSRPATTCSDCCARASARRTHRHRHRPLLRDGPRQALGPGREGLLRDGRRPRAAHSPTPLGRGSRPPMPTDVTDEFVVPAVIGDYRGHAGRRRHPVLQFPRRPGAGDPGRAARPGLRRLPAPAHRSASPPRRA